jgi:hypothetical protein
VYVLHAETPSLPPVASAKPTSGDAAPSQHGARVVERPVLVGIVELVRRADSGADLVLEEELVGAIRRASRTRRTACAT